MFDTTGYKIHAHHGAWPGWYHLCLNLSQKSPKLHYQESCTCPHIIKRTCLVGGCMFVNVQWLTLLEYPAEPKMSVGSNTSLWDESGVIDVLSAERWGPHALPGVKRSSHITGEGIWFSSYVMKQPREAFGCTWNALGILSVCLLEACFVLFCFDVTLFFFSTLHLELWAGSTETV